MNYPSERALGAVFAFAETPPTDESKEIKMQFMADEISAYVYAEKAGRYIKEKEAHKSDCALHNGPATTPLPCDCDVNSWVTPQVYGSEFPSNR